MSTPIRFLRILISAPYSWDVVLLGRMFGEMRRPGRLSDDCPFHLVPLLYTGNVAYSCNTSGDISMMSVEMFAHDPLNFRNDIIVGSFTISDATTPTEADG